ncbi:MAG: nucleotidyltransferase family protein [Bacteroidales bacterium]|nr:nucleotidyltransferase family protein [Candidatus Physcousia equi]
MKREENIVVQLIKWGIGTERPTKKSVARLLEKQVNWDTVFALCHRQNVTAICCDGLNQVYETFPGIVLPIDHPKREQALFELFGKTMSGELHYDHQRKAIARLAAFYAQHGIGMMVLKGYGLSLHYPTPEHRPTGDIDIFLFHLDEDSTAELPAWKKADDAMRRELAIPIRNDSEHHTKFLFQGISVENHYDFINTKLHRSSKRLERIFKTLSQEERTPCRIEEQDIYLPGTRLNELFLLRHSSSHFAAEGITMRTVLDWALFVQHHTVDWCWLGAEAKRFNMHLFLAALNRICVEDLGFQKDQFPYTDATSTFKERILQDIMSAADAVHHASSSSRLMRWWRNRWKHRICYSDSLLSTFLTSTFTNLFSKASAE